MPMSYLADQLHKDSLAFRMLRMHGRDVSPSKNFSFLCLSSLFVFSFQLHIKFSLKYKTVVLFRHKALPFCSS